MTDHERIERLERCLLSFISTVTGELQAIASQEEFATSQAFLARELEQMQGDL